MTPDIFNITTPFGLLDEETQKALKEWKGVWEIYDIEGKWSSRYEPTWGFTCVYRAIPLPLTKPSINWDHVSGEWQWLARDSLGNTYLYIEEPKISRGSECWCSVYVSRLADTFSSFSPGDCDWKDSLVQRPAKDMSELL
jgi:hypothetical protein